MGILVRLISAGLVREFSEVSVWVDLVQAGEGSSFCVEESCDSFAASAYLAEFLGDGAVAACLAEFIGDGAVAAGLFDDGRQVFRLP